MCVESFVEVCEYCVVVVSLKVRFEQVELCITLKWTGHKELDYCKKRVGIKVDDGVVIIRWHQAWGESREGEGEG